jgi:hypothetical protein
MATLDLTDQSSLSAWLRPTCTTENLSCDLLALQQAVHFERRLPTRSKEEVSRKGQNLLPREGYCVSAKGKALADDAAQTIDRRVRLQDPLLKTLRDIKSHGKKITRAKGASVER